MQRIRKRDLAKVFFRSFFSQAAFNQERMLGLGFCFAIMPVARRLYEKNKEKSIDFFMRHIEFFNSHPFMITYALGAVANLEQQAILKRWENLRPIEVFKKRVIGPLGAIGDTLFWKFYLPMTSLLGVTLGWIYGIVGAIVFLILFNLGHLTIRIRGVVRGYKKGFDIIRDLSLRGTKKYFAIMEKVFAVLSALALLVFLHSFKAMSHSLVGASVFIMASIFSFFTNKRSKFTVELQLVIVILAAIIIGLMFTS